MKTTIKSFLAMAIAAFAFTACSDVPQPEGYNQNSGSQVIVFDPTGSGTKDDPYTATDAINYAKSLNNQESTDAVYIKGKVVAVSEAFTTQYGNGTFTISDDGMPGSVFTAYRVLYLGNQKFKSSDTQIQVGDDVIIYGRVVNYRGNTPETVQGTAYLYSLNGKTADAGGQGGEGAEPAGTGTQADPYNVAGVLKYIGTLGADNESPADVFIKGKVKDITEQFGTQYGNATFTICDEGFTQTFTIYRALYLGNKKYSSGDLLKEGDEVIICGRVVNFRGNTPETAQGKAYLFSLNGKSGSGSTDPTPTTGEAKGSGTLADPYNPAGAIKLAEATGTGESAEVYIKGKVSSIKFNYQADQYGNATFYISEDGTSNGEFYCFRTLYLGNQKYTKGLLLKQGDEVVICGKVTNYMGNTPETVQNASYLYSLNGSTEITEGSDEPGGEEPGGEEPGGVVSGNSISVTFADLGLANQEKPTTLTLNDGTTLTFDAGSNKNAPAYYNTGSALRMYPQNTLTINAGSKKIAAIEMTCDEYQGTLYNASGDIAVNGTKMTVSGSSLKYTGPNATTATVANVSETTGAPSQLRMKTLVITYAQ